MGVGDDWDCLPQSLTWSVTQQLVAVVTEASTSESQRHDTEIQFYRLEFHLKAATKSSTSTLKLKHEDTLPPLCKRRQMTRCLGDCYHCVTNWWIINKNTHTQSALKLCGSASQSAAVPQELHHLGNQGADWKCNGFTIQVQRDKLHITVSVDWSSSNYRIKCS